MQSSAIGTGTPRTPELRGDRRERREARLVLDGDLGQVVAYEPVARDVRGVEREHDDTPARNAA